MTATERLRQLLDERGVEWHGVEDSTYWGEVLLTRRDGSDPVYKFRAHKTANRLSVHLLQVTPERAVEATLGRGTCEVEGSIDYGEFGCWQYDLSCGCRIIWPDNEPPTFCPECGRMVEA